MSNSGNGEVSNATLFHYRQNGAAIMASYSGGSIREGTLLGQIDEDGVLTFSYQHYNMENEFRTGRCVSTPEFLGNGKLRYHESWEWTNGLAGTGTSVIEEV